MLADVVLVDVEAGADVAFHIFEPVSFAVSVMSRAVVVPPSVTVIAGSTVSREMASVLVGHLFPALSMILTDCEPVRVEEIVRVYRMRSAPMILFGIPGDQSSGVVVKVGF